MSEGPSSTIKDRVAFYQELEQKGRTTDEKSSSPLVCKKITTTRTKNALIAETSTTLIGVETEISADAPASTQAHAPAIIRPFRVLGKLEGPLASFFEAQAASVPDHEDPHRLMLGSWGLRKLESDAVRSLREAFQGGKAIVHVHPQQGVIEETFAILGAGRACPFSGTADRVELHSIWLGPRGLVQETFVAPPSESYDGETKDAHAQRYAWWLAPTAPGTLDETSVGSMTESLRLASVGADATNTVRGDGSFNLVGGAVQQTDVVVYNSIPNYINRFGADWMTVDHDTYPGRDVMCPAGSFRGTCIVTSTATPITLRSHSGGMDGCYVHISMDVAFRFPTDKSKAGIPYGCTVRAVPGMFLQQGTAPAYTPAYADLFQRITHAPGEELLANLDMRPAPTSLDATSSICWDVPTTELGSVVCFGGTDSDGTGVVEYPSSSKYLFEKSGHISLPGVAVRQACGVDLTRTAPFFYVSLNPSNLFQFLSSVDGLPYLPSGPSLPFDYVVTPSCKPPIGVPCNSSYIIGDGDWASTKPDSSVAWSFTWATSSETSPEFDDKINKTNTDGSKNARPLRSVGPFQWVWGFGPQGNGGSSTVLPKHLSVGLQFYIGYRGEIDDVDGLRYGGDISHSFRVELPYL